MLGILASILLWRGSAAPDPSPSILLSLLLSCLAALQAPVIMMSQKARDRQRSERFPEIQEIQVYLLWQIVRTQLGQRPADEAEKGIS